MLFQEQHFFLHQLQRIRQSFFQDLLLIFSLQKRFPMPLTPGFLML